LASGLLRNKFEQTVRDLDKNLTNKFLIKGAKIVKRMEGLNNVNFRADGFPDELIDYKQEEKEYEI